jgi:hypothetical protein
MNRTGAEKKRQQHGGKPDRHDIFQLGMQDEGKTFSDHTVYF